MENTESIIKLLEQFYDYLIDDNWIGEIYPDERDDNIDHFFKTNHSKIFEILTKIDND